MFAQTAAAWSGSSRSFKRAVKFAGGVGVIAGAITASAAAWVIVEPVSPAHRAYVREQKASVEDKLTRSIAPLVAATNEAQIDFAWTRQLQIDNDIDRWSLSLEKATDDTEKLRIRSSIRALQREHKLLGEKIDAVKARGQ